MFAHIDHILTFAPFLFASLLQRSDSCYCSQTLAKGRVCEKWTADVDEHRRIWRRRGVIQQFFHFRSHIRITFRTNGTKVLYYFPAGRCSPLSALVNASTADRLAENGSVAVYHCDSGHVFPGGQFSVATMCDGNSWNLTQTHCKGMKYEYILM